MMKFLQARCVTIALKSAAHGSIAALCATFWAGSAGAAGYAVAPVDDGGRLAGKVEMDVPRPQVERFIITKNNWVCGQATRDVPLVRLKGKVLLDAVVIIQGIRQGKPFRAAARKITVNQEKCRFLPHVAVFANNGDVEVVNSDPILHNVHIYKIRNNKRTSVLNVSQPQRGDITSKKITLKRGGPLLVTCDAHNFMRGHLYAAQSPYYAVVDQNGRYLIDRVPPGDYEVIVWHPVLGAKKSRVKVRSGETSGLNFTY